MLATLLAIASALIALVFVPAGLYLGALGLLATRPTRPNYAPSSLRFAILVPAHNEATGIVHTVANLFALTWERSHFRVVVIADNCSDNTAELARAAGAEVLERQDANNRGKGFALQHAFEVLLAEPADRAVDAVVVVDADSVVSPHLLQAFAHRIAAGAHAVQADYFVANVDASWRTRLMAFALGMAHRVRASARERLGVSVGLRGNGMCFTRSALARFPHDAHGLVEDVEHGIALGMGGERVHYAGEASVLGEMATTSQAAASQRQRWEGGRLALARTHLARLLTAAVQKRSGVLLDLAIDLAIPPLAYVGLGFALGFVVEGAHVLLAGTPTGALGFLVVGTLGVVGYAVRGIMLSGLGWGAIGVVAWAPVYVVWKVALVFKRKSEGWVRTTREAEIRKPD